MSTIFWGEFRVLDCLIGLYGNGLGGVCIYRSHIPKRFGLFTLLRGCCSVIFDVLPLSIMLTLHAPSFRIYPAIQWLSDSSRL